MATIKERAEDAWAVYEYREGCLYNTTFEDGYIQGATEMEQNPSDALIMRILNCIGYEEEGWIGFVRKELEKRKDDNSPDATKINPLLAECLSEVNPDTRAEVRKNMDADHFRDATQMIADPDTLWVEWYTENADKLTISCYADETLSHCSFVAGYRAHEALMYHQFTKAMAEVDSHPIMFPLATQPFWHKASEELPKEDDVYYVAGVGFYDKANWCKGQWRNYSAPITHWMPIPKIKED